MVETNLRISPAPTTKEHELWLTWVPPVLEAKPDGPARRLAGALKSLHPALIFVVTMLVGFVLISGLSIGLGLLVTHLLEPIAGERVDVWLAHHRAPGRTDASLIGSMIAGGVVLPIIVFVVALVCAVLRKWRIAAFMVFALAVESGTYRATTLAIHSHRPRVPRLEHLPVNASYPSGHTAASLAVYGGIALLLTSWISNRWVRVVVWTLVIAIVAFVATSRMYRGMHHPIDVAGGLIVGIAALCVVVFACRTAGAAAEARS